MDNIEDILNTVIGKLSLKQPDKHNKIERILFNSLTEAERKHIEINKLENNILYVNVTSPVLLFQLKIKRNKILQRLQEEISEIRNIIFRIGKS